MKLKVLVALASLITLSPVFAQDDLFTEAFTDFSSRRLWSFEEIPVEWKMEGTLQADLNEGLNSLLEDDPKIAIEHLSAVIARDSTIWQAYYYRGAASKKLRNFAHAKKDMQRALKLHGDFYEGFVELAKILHLSWDSYESERAINKAIRLDRSRGTAYYLKGDINLSQNEPRKAINNYKDCLAADSLFHDARIKVALLDGIDRKDVSGAIKHLNKVLEYDSLQKTALLFRSLLIAEKDKQQSVKDLTSLLRVSPGNLMALYFRGNYAAELGEYERAFNDFHKLIRETSMDDNYFVGQQSWLDKKIDLQNAGAYTITRVYGLPEQDASLIKRSYCHIVVHEYDKALSTIALVSGGKKEPVVAYLKAVAYEHKGEHVKALQHYSIALGLDKDITDAYKKCGIYEQELKEWEKSIYHFNNALRLSPDNIFINRLRGLSYYNLSDYDKALADFDSYLKKDSTSKVVLGFRGMVYAKANQRLKAYVDFAASDNLTALNFKEIEHLVDSVLLARDTAQALYSLDVITNAAPWFTEGYVQKFKIHMARHDWESIEGKVMMAVRNSRVDAGKRHHSYLLTMQGMLYAYARQTEDAVKTLNEAIRFDSKNSLAYLERGRIFLAMRKTSKAASDFRDAAELGNAKAKQLLAEIPK
jgi:tetratricopeptide (TPR) repeat protein